MKVVGYKTGPGNSRSVCKTDPSSSRLAWKTRSRKSTWVRRIGPGSCRRRCAERDLGLVSGWAGRDLGTADGRAERVKEEKIIVRKRDWNRDLRKLRHLKKLQQIWGVIVNLYDERTKGIIMWSRIKSDVRNDTDTAECEAKGWQYKPNVAAWYLVILFRW